jgi:hypothetical protein
MVSAIRKLSLLWLVAMFWWGSALIGGCSKKIVDGWPKRIPKGVAFTPKSFEPVDFVDFFQKAGQAGGVVSWAGDWNELGDTVDGAPKVVAELAPEYALIPMVEAQFFTQSTGQLLRPLTEETKQSYKQVAAVFAKKYQLKFLALGIEVNILWEKSAADLDLFVPFFAEVCDTVKTVSPNTKVFTIFQLEKMKGLSGGLFGGTNDPNNAEWELLNRFPKSDLIAFTTYPSLVFGSPSEIPTDHYAEVKSHTSKQIAFTEIGWHSSASPAGWESSEAEQAEFVQRFFNLTRGLDEEMAVWSFMYDQNTGEPFNSMGLLRSDGITKSAWNKWVQANPEKGE